MPFIRLDKATARDRLAALVDRYALQSAQLEAFGSTYLESQARLDFIDEFLRIFGWDISNESGAPQSDREVVVEKYIDLDDEDESNGRPDYTFRHARQPRLVVEAKRPAVKVRIRPGPALQTRSYGWSLPIPAAVLTNFSDTVFYDATIEPNIGDGPDQAMLPELHFHFTEYVARFDDLWARLSHEVLSTEQFYAAYSYEEPPRGMSGFDLAFLEQFRSWRLRLATDIARNNPGMSPNEVGRQTQRLLNALLFLRICENRRIETYRDLLVGAQNNALTARFAEADRVYNAGLFSLLGSSGVSDSALLSVVRQMYWPVSKYAFGVLQPEVLAGIYDQFLAERIVIDGSVRLERKPEITHASGIVSTPDYIVDGLIARGLGPLLRNQTGGNTRPLRILDMSQGSGVFLLGVLRELILHHERTIGTTTLAVRATLVRDHLFGVDIDDDAVEVARLSLLLAILGDEAVDTRVARSVLPDLSSNLFAGNSLIDSKFDENFPAAASDPRRRASVRPFDWQAAMPQITPPGGKGFDLIIGNPPYVRIQELALHFPDQLAAFQSPRFGYASAQNSFDVYMLFLEKAVSLLSERGRMAMIVPQRFTMLPVAGPLRTILGPLVEELVHFGTQQVFPQRTTYSALLIASREAGPDVLVEAVRDLDEWRSGIPGEVRLVPRATLTAAPWPLASEARSRIFQRMKAVTTRQVKDVADIFVGVQTSADDLLFITPTEISGGVVDFQDPSGKPWTIEMDLLRPALKDRKMIPFDANPVPDRYAIFPYFHEQDSDGEARAVRIPPDEMQARYPLGWEYLLHHRTSLLGRSITPDPGPAFYAYGRSQSLAKMHEPKIIVRGMSLIPQYAWDETGLVAAGGGTGGPYYLMRPFADSDVPQQILIAVLSHPAVEALLAETAPINRGGYVSHRKAELQNLPLPTFTSEEERELVALVDELHSSAIEARELTEPDIQQAAADRRVWVRARVDQIVSRAFDLAADDLEALTP